MALDAAHRASIYQKLRPVLGDDDANVLMSEFPSIEAHELVTKDFLRAEMSALRGEMYTQFGSVDAEFGSVRGEIASVRAEMHTGFSSIDARFSDVRAEMAGVKSALTVRMGSAIAASTALLAAVGIFT